MPNLIDVEVRKPYQGTADDTWLSQQVLAKALGVTFQQVQKYEKGSNFVGVSRLSRIAVLLGVPISFVFERKGSGEADPGASDERASADPVLAFLSTDAELALNRAFVRIASKISAGTWSPSEGIRSRGRSG